MVVGEELGLYSQAAGVQFLALPPVTWMILKKFLRHFLPLFPPLLPGNKNRTYLMAWFQGLHVLIICKVFKIVFGT